MLAIEVTRRGAGAGSGVSRQDMIAQLQVEGVTGRSLCLRRTASGLRLPRSEQKAKPGPRIRLGWGLCGSLRGDSAGSQQGQGGQSCKTFSSWAESTPAPSAQSMRGLAGEDWNFFRRRILGLYWTRPKGEFDTLEKESVSLCVIWFSSLAG